MGWYKRSGRLIFDSVRRYCTSKIDAVPGNPIRGSVSRISSRISSFRHGLCNVGNSRIPRLNLWNSTLQPGFRQNHFPYGAKSFYTSSFTTNFPETRIYQSILRNIAMKNALKQNLWNIPFLGGATRSYYSSSRHGSRLSGIGGIFQPLHKISSFQNCLKQTQRKSPFLGGAKRFYYVDRGQIHHFKPRGYKRWLQNPKNVLIMILVGGGVIITVYFGNLETVPYTKRTHFVLLSWNMEKELGESQFTQLKGQFKGRILPALHPESIRVQRISQYIIEALHKGLRKEQVWSDLRYSPGSIELTQEVRGPAIALADRIEEEKWISEDKWHKEDEILDDQWVQKSRRKGQEKGMKSQTGHLEGLKWEVIVVDEPVINAFCLPGGKIVVFTGLLKHFRTDAELATIIGHEVGHVVARHNAEQLSKNLWLTILQLILSQFVPHDVVYTMSNLLLKLPFSRRMEMEADYIGLLLLASAGFDPRVAPQVYLKLGQIAGESKLQDYLATHPSGTKRAQVLAQAKVMEEAFAIYRENQAGRGVEGFL